MTLDKSTQLQSANNVTISECKDKKIIKWIINNNTNNKFTSKLTLHKPHVTLIKQFQSYSTSLFVWQRLKEHYM